MDPLVVVGPFGSGKRGVLGKLVRELMAGVVVAPPVTTTRGRVDGGGVDGESYGWMGGLGWLGGWFWSCCVWRCGRSHP